MLGNTEKEMFNEKFHGFYRGEVVDVLDPKKNGAVKVRVYPMFANAEPTDIPWAILADPGFGGTRDVGEIRVPEVGSHVFVFFENGDHRYPVYFAGAPAIQTDIPDTPKLSREDDGTHAAIDAARKTGVAKAGGGTWDEPASSYAAEYPKNKVIKTASGIIVEMDDTVNATRFHIHHPSGTNEEVDNTGNKTERVKGKKTTVVISDNNIKVEGDMNVNVSTNGTVKIGANANIEVAGNAEISVDGDTNVTTTNATVTADKVDVDSTNVNLDVNGTPAGIVTQNHVCAFTGNPHPQGSTSCKAGG